MILYFANGKNMGMVKLAKATRQKKTQTHERKIKRADDVQKYINAFQVNSIW